MNTYKVSVIVPIYKVEKFIRHCAQTLLEQSLLDVEIIFVDDCTPDNSINVLRDLIKDYPGKENFVKIIRHETNKGLPSARNTGLQFATGEYVFHCDSDDWLEKNALELLYNKAKEDSADIVWCDWFLSFQDNERHMSQQTQISEVASGTAILKLMLGGKIKYNVWNKLIKRSLYVDNGITFPDGYGMGEDLTIMKLFVFAERVTYLNKALYHYVRLNNEAFTSNTTSQHLEQLKYNVDNLVLFLDDHYGEKLKEDIHFFKLNIKLPFLISSEKASYERWNSWYKGSNEYINKNPLFNWRTRFIQQMAVKRQYWVLRLYYFLVIRVVYGVIYK